MKVSPARHTKGQVLGCLILILGLGITYLAYQPATGGTFYFDDEANLRGLAEVEDRASFSQFVLSGIAGPLGRPLSLFTFAAQAYAWPNDPAVFLHTNILIHLLNGALLAWFLFLLGRARGGTVDQSALVAASAAVLWSLLPILASSSLLVIQRMTTLAASFSLIGGIGYLMARKRLVEYPFLALAGMTAALGLGAVLGALAKESGILLIAFILATEITLLNRPEAFSRRVWYAWFFLFLALPTLILASYLISALPYPESTVLQRNFGGTERLINQAEILWRYLWLSFLPSVPKLGPFHDDLTIRRHLFEPVPLLSVIAWTLAIGLAIKWRRRFPLFAFAVAWYLAGHMLESTTLGLELYFEHRNYLPLIGPIYALVASVPLVAAAWKRLAVLGLVAFGVVQAAVLFSTASLWGSPHLAAEMWNIYRPNSLRGTQHLAKQLIIDRDMRTAQKVLERYYAANPDQHHVGLQILLISCQRSPNIDHSTEARQLAVSMKDAPFSSSSIRALQELQQLVQRSSCLGLDNDIIYSIAAKMLSNPRYTMPIVRHNIHAVLAGVGVEKRDFALAAFHIEEALRAHYHFDTMIDAIAIFESGDRLDLAIELMEHIRARPLPTNPARARQFKRDMDSAESLLAAARNFDVHSDESE
jgi:protein O-mannosyl-transferase